MGSIATYILRHGKVIIAWAALLSAFAAFIYGLRTTALYTNITTVVSSSVSALSDIAVQLPEAVGHVNDVIHDNITSEGNGGWPALLYWVFCADRVQSYLTGIGASIAILLSLCVTMITACITLGGFIWVLRRVQRWIVAITGGDGNGMQVVD